MRLKQTLRERRSERIGAKLDAQAEKAGLQNLIGLLGDQLLPDLKDDLKRGQYGLMHRQDWHFLARLYHLPGHDQDLSLKARVLQHVAIKHARAL
jgi:hypothetical protein